MKQEALMKQRDRRAARKLAGLCRDCGGATELSPAGKRFSQCQTCLVKAVGYQKKRRGKLKEKAGLVGSSDPQSGSGSGSSGP